MVYMEGMSRPTIKVKKLTNDKDVKVSVENSRSEPDIVSYAWYIMRLVKYVVLGVLL